MANDRLAVLPKKRRAGSLSAVESGIVALELTTCENAYQLGAFLIEAKDEHLERGQFVPWLQSKLKWRDKRTWRRYMDFTIRCDMAGKLLAVLGKSDKLSLSERSQPKLPEGKYRVIYADPPWEYRNSGFNQAAASQYRTMSTEDICKLPIQQMASDSVLYLWITSPTLPDGLRVMEAWGFEYKSSMVWVKDRAPGMGWWANTKHELLLVGSCGNVGTPTIKHDSVFEAPVGRHSEKPAIVRTMIESMFPGPYIELFARQRTEGWEVWGNEAPQQAGDN